MVQLKRDIVCLVSSIDNLLEYKQKLKLTSVGTLEDINAQLEQFLKSLGVEEDVTVDMFDTALEIWIPLSDFGSCPNKVKLRIKRAHHPRTRTRTVSASRQKGDMRYINGRLRIWSGTRWNCEHDRRLSECKFCAANNQADMNPLIRQKSDSCVPWTSHQKKRRLGTYDGQVLGRQHSMPTDLASIDLGTKPLQQHVHTVNATEFQLLWDKQIEATPSSSNKSGNHEDDESWFWDLVEVLK